MRRFLSTESIADAFNKARSDLADVGLLVDGHYLDRIECALTAWPSGWSNEAGWVYDNGPTWLHEQVGFKPGVIYIPFDAPTQAYSPGATLTDVIRHEFAHAWYWLDRRFVDGPWFREAFGAPYNAAPLHVDPDRASFVSDYAATLPKEDFAETFMYFLKYRRSLERFRTRRGVFRKLRAVEKVVRLAARTRASRL